MAPALLILLIGCTADDLTHATAHRRLRLAHPEMQWDSSRELRADLDCDGKADYSFLGHQPGKVFVGVVRAGGQSAQALEFAVDPGQPAAICAKPAQLELMSLDYDPAEVSSQLEGFQRSTTCYGLKLSGSGAECPPIRLYWNHNADHLAWWRP